MGQPQKKREIPAGWPTVQKQHWPEEAEPSPHALFGAGSAFRLSTDLAYSGHPTHSPMAQCRLDVRPRCR
jgi:hypothetical protein